MLNKYYNCVTRFLFKYMLVADNDSLNYDLYKNREMYNDTQYL